jgi:hypothetical protein
LSSINNLEGDVKEKIGYLHFSGWEIPQTCLLTQLFSKVHYLHAKAIKAFS